MSPSQVSILQKPTNCLLTNEVPHLFLEGLGLLKDNSQHKYPIFFFICLHMVAFENFQYDIIFDVSMTFVNTFFLHLDADIASQWIHLMELFVNI